MNNILLQFLKTNRLNILYCFIFSLLYILPIVLANVFIADDIGRAVSAYGWHQDGRIFSSYLMQALSLGALIKDFYPYTLIFGALFISLSGLIISNVLNLEKNKFFIFSSLVLITNPLLIENLGFRYDSFFMGLSMLIAVIPFLFYKNIKYFIVVSVLSIYIVLFSYQASLTIYLSMILCLSIVRLFKEDYKSIIKFALISLVPITIGLILMKLTSFIVDFSYGGREQIVFASSNFTEDLKRNINSILNLITHIFNSHYKFIFIIGALIALFCLIKMFFLKISIINKLLIITCFLLIPISTHIIFLTLTNAPLNPRGLIGFSFIFYSFLIIINQFSTKIVSILSIIYALIALPLMSSFANILEKQDNFQKAIINDVTNHVDFNGKKFVIDGESPLNKEAKTSLLNYEFIYYIQFNFINSDKFLVEEYFKHSMNYLYSPTFIFGNDRESILKNKSNYPIVHRTNYYFIRELNNTIILDFKIFDVEAIPTYYQNENIQPNGIVLGTVDTIEEKNNIININGWATLNTTKQQEDIKVILIGEKDKYIVTSAPQERFDVSEAIGSPSKDLGYSVKINIATITPGNYKIALLLGENNYFLSDKIFIKK